MLIDNNKLARGKAVAANAPIKHVGYSEEKPRGEVGLGGGGGYGTWYRIHHIETSSMKVLQGHNNQTDGINGHAVEGMEGRGGQEG